MTCSLTHLLFPSTRKLLSSTWPLVSHTSSAFPIELAHRKVSQHHQYIASTSHALSAVMEEDSHFRSYEGSAQVDKRHMDQESSFGFMDLPAELRLEVYHYLLDVGKVFSIPAHNEDQNDRFKEYQTFEKPAVSILRVSKQIPTEAEDVYLTTNLFVLPRAWFLQVPQVVDMQTPGDNFFPKSVRRLFSDAATSRVGSLSLGLSQERDGPVTLKSLDRNRDGDDSKQQAIADKVSYTPQRACGTFFDESCQNIEGSISIHQPSHARARLLRCVLPA